MKVKIKKLNSLAKTPTKFHDEDFCYDVYATSCEEIEPGIWKYGLGLAFEIDRDSADFVIGKTRVLETRCHGLFSNEFYTTKDTYLALDDIKISIDFRPRSSIWKTGLTLSNCEGTIDELYRGEVMAYFYEVIPGKEKYKVGDRIGQIKLGFTLPIEFEEVNELSETTRGEGGFGSTDKLNLKNIPIDAK